MSSSVGAGSSPNALGNGKYHRYYKKGNYYLCLAYVEFTGIAFVGKTYRKYDEEQQDFELLDTEEQLDVEIAFESRVDTYTSQFGLR